MLFSCLFIFTVYYTDVIGKVKHLAYYDKDRRQAVCIDFEHYHNGKRPHKHLYLNHTDDTPELNSEDWKNINKLKRRYKVNANK